MAFAAARAWADDAVTVELTRTAWSVPPSFGCLPTQFGNVITVKDKSIQILVLIDLGSDRSDPVPLSGQQMSEIQQLVAKWDSNSDPIEWDRDEQRYCIHDVYADAKSYRASSRDRTMPSSIWAIMRWVLDHKPACPGRSSYCS
jgi:hypothetical protein